MVFTVKRVIERWISKWNSTYKGWRKRRCTNEGRHRVRIWGMHRLCVWMGRAASLKKVDEIVSKVKIYPDYEDLDIPLEISHRLYIWGGWNYSQIYRKESRSLRPESKIKSSLLSHYYLKPVVKNFLKCISVMLKQD